MKIVKKLMITAFALYFGLAVPLGAMASGNTSSVEKAGNSVVKVNYYYADPDYGDMILMSNTGFAVNENTVVTTCAAVNLNQDLIDMTSELLGITKEQLVENTQIRVSAKAGGSCMAEIRFDDQKTDLAVLELEGKLDGCSGIPVRSSSELTASEECSVLWFSPIVTYSQDGPNEDCFTAHGKVKEVVTKGGIELVRYKADNAVFEQPSSGPLVDAGGNVIGFTTGAASSNGNDDCYAVSSDTLIRHLKNCNVHFSSPETSKQEDEKPSQRKSDPPTLIKPSPFKKNTTGWE